MIVFACSQLGGVFFRDFRISVQGCFGLFSTNVATVKNQEEACRRQSPFFRPESGDTFTFEEVMGQQHSF